MRRLLARWLDEAGASRSDIDDLVLAGAEAAANAIEHAYGLAPAWWSCAPGRPEDGGVEGRHPRLRELARAARHAPRPRPSLMEGLTDGVEVVRSDEGTTIELSRRLGAEVA